MVTMHTFLIRFFRNYNIQSKPSTPPSWWFSSCCSPSLSTFMLECAYYLTDKFHWSMNPLVEINIILQVRFLFLLANKVIFFLDNCSFDRADVDQRKFGGISQLGLYLIKALHLEAKGKDNRFFIPSIFIQEGPLPSLRFPPLPLPSYAILSPSSRLPFIPPPYLSDNFRIVCLRCLFLVWTVVDTGLLVYWLALY